MRRSGPGAGRYGRWGDGFVPKSERKQQSRHSLRFFFCLFLRTSSSQNWNIIEQQVRLEHLFRTLEARLKDLASENSSAWRRTRPGRMASEIAGFSLRWAVGRQVEETWERFNGWLPSLLLPCKLEKHHSAPSSTCIGTFPSARQMAVVKKGSLQAGKQVL